MPTDKYYPTMCENYTKRKDAKRRVRTLERKLEIAKLEWWVLEVQKVNRNTMTDNAELRAAAQREAAAGAVHAQRIGTLLTDIRKALVNPNADAIAYDVREIYKRYVDAPAS